MSVIKVIKIGLPVATATSAAIATTSLVSFSKKDKLPTEEDLDKKIDDLKLPDEKYQDEKLFYSKDGTGKNQKVLDPETAEKLAQLLKEQGSLDSLDKSDQNVKLPANLDDVGLSDTDAKSPITLDLEKSTEKGLQQIPNDGGSEDERGSTELQNPANLSDSIDRPKDNVDDDIKGQGTENEPTSKEPPSGDGEQQGDEPTLPEKLLRSEGLGSQDQPQDISTEDEGNHTKDASNSSLNGMDSDDNLDQNEAQPGLETDVTKDVGILNNSELGAQAGQQEQNEVNDLSQDGRGKNDEPGGAPKDSDVNGDGRSSDGGNSLNEGTDPSGNRQNLTEEDIEKWSGVEAEISEVVGQLQNLINI